MKVRSKAAAAVMLCALLATSACSSDSSDGAGTDTGDTTTTAEAATTSEGAAPDATETTVDGGTTETSEAGSPDVTAPAPEGDEVEAADATCAAFGAYLEKESASKEITLEAEAQPGVPCNYSSVDFERAILETFPRDPEGNAQQKDFEVVCQDVADGRGDAPESNYVKDRARHMTSKALTSATSDDGDPAIDGLLGEVLNGADNPNDVFFITCDDENAYQGRLRINNADPEYYVNPQLLVNATAAGVNA